VSDAAIRAGRVARGLAGTLRVGFTESASWHGVVPDSFRQFRDAQPDAELQLSPLLSLEEVEAVRSGRLDAGFVLNMPKTDPELDQVQVAPQKLVLAVPKGHPLTRPKSLRLRDLADSDFVGFPRRQSPAYYRPRTSCRRPRIRPPCSPSLPAGSGSPS
jgi:DNA-binding transcriptional LysR family regulator